jgi:two-component sensor histidine kinase
VLLVVPVTIFVGWVLWQYAAAERAHLLENGQALVHRIGDAVESETASIMGTAKLAASSPRLLQGQLEPEESRRTAAAVARSLGVDIAIRDVGGQLLVNTRLPQDQKLPSRPLEADRTVLTTKQAAVSELFLGSSNKEPLVAVVAPVVQPTTGEVVYLIDITVPAKRILDVILKESLGGGLYATVLDQKGRVIARTRGQQQFVGTEATEFMRGVTGREGNFRTRSLDGVPVLVHYARITGSDWIVAVGLEEETLNAPIRRLIGFLVAIGMCLALLSALLAYLFGRRITKAIQGLSAAASALGAGLPVAPLQTPIREVNQVSAALAEAARERERAEERQALMVRELHHRVKNTLATVQAVVNSTARRAQTITEFSDAVTERIISLARTHTLLVDDAWGGASLHQILKTELEPYNNGQQRVKLDGPEVHLPDSIALAFGMAVHELTTNAAKYGALSLPTGCVQVTWSVEGTDSDRRLHLEWREGDGPPVEIPKRKGFGSTLLERVLGRQLQGEVTTEYLPEGIRVRVDAPLTEHTVRKAELT